jgi:septum formation protein
MTAGLRTHGFWLDAAPLVLASGSATRRALLEAAQIPLEILKAPVNEVSIAATLLEQSETPHAIAIALAHAKAEAATRKMPERLILAADQTLDHEGSLLMKPADRDHARQQLKRLRGGPHFLHSAAVLRKGDRVLWAGVASARLTMRDFSDAFLETYLDVIGPVISETVGGYQLEALGVHLFEEIEGDHTTILGLPLIPVLHALRDLGCLAA